MDTRLNTTTDVLEISIPVDDLVQIDWSTESETGAVDYKYGFFEIDGREDTVGAYAIGRKAIGIHRTAYGQTLVIPVEVLPTLIETLVTIVEQNQMVQP